MRLPGHGNVSSAASAADVPRPAPRPQRAHLANVVPQVHGMVSTRSVELEGMTVTEVTYGVGARWSADLKADVGTDLCQDPHVAYVLSGTVRVGMADGTKEDFTAGDVMLLPPGHDAWTVGDRPCVYVEFCRPDDRRGG